MIYTQAKASKELLGRSRLQLPRLPNQNLKGNAILAEEDLDLYRLNKTVFNYDTYTRDLIATHNIEEQNKDEQFWSYFKKNPTVSSELSVEKVYLAVSFSEKDEAKSLGSKWDKENKCWYAEKIKETPQLEKFIKQSEHVKSSGTTLEEFKQELLKIGISAEKFNDEPNKWHRAPIIGKDAGNTDGAYKIYTNMDGTIGGYAKNMTTGEEIKWTNREVGNTEKPPVEVERAYVLNSAIQAQERENRQHKVYEERAREAKMLYSFASPAQADAPYIENKGMKNFSGIKALEDGSLVVPLFSGASKDFSVDEITSLQVIRPDGQKSLMTGAQKSGSFFVFGDERARQQPDLVIVAEGVATFDSFFQSSWKTHYYRY